MNRALLLLIWGWMVLWSVHSGRLDLLMNSVFHGLVGATGIALIVAGLLLLRRQRRPLERLRISWIASTGVAVLMVLAPPAPSFSDLASNRPQGIPQAPQLAFVLPPEQRSLTEWVRLLRSQPDPELVDGNPVNISGFVWRQNNAPPLIARLTVRCCLADATPAGLAVAWPETSEPKANQWLAIRGHMAVQLRNGNPMVVVVPTTIEEIERPERPLEP